MINYSDIEIRQQLILDHYEHPKHKVADNKKMDGYKSSSNNSPSCIDNITAYMKLKNNVIQDIKFSGVGCAIATSSTDLMAKLLIGKKSSEAQKIINNYLEMVNGKKFDKKMLGGPLEVFDNIHKQTNRIKCASVGIIAINNTLKNDK